MVVVVGGGGGLIEGGIDTTRPVRAALPGRPGVSTESRSSTLPVSAVPTLFATAQASPGPFRPVKTASSVAGGGMGRDALRTVANRAKTALTGAVRTGLVPISKRFFSPHPPPPRLVSPFSYAIPSRQEVDSLCYGDVRRDERERERLEGERCVFDSSDATPGILSRDRAMCWFLWRRDGRRNANFPPWESWVIGSN